MNRILTAVLAADVADYSRLMGEDAEATLAALRRLRAELFGPMVAGHRGQVVKSMGDGWIVTFATASEAVTCAMRLQDQMVMEPDIRLRLGVHLGDIVHEEEDVFGDGANVAARLEALCEPGGVTISDAVHGALDGTLRPAFDDAGEQSLKNIDRPVRVWTRGGITGAAMLKGRNGIEGFPQLAIRPVAASGGSEELRDLADALTHDLGTYMGTTRWLRTKVSMVSDAGSFVLTSKLRASGSRIRLESRLTAPGGGVIWSGKRDGTLDVVFDWQDETASDVATQTMNAVSRQALSLIEAKPEPDRGWEDWVLLGMVRYRPNREGVSQLLGCLKAATDLDPDQGYPYEAALMALASTSSLGYSDLVQAYAPISSDWRKKSRAISDISPSAEIVLATTAFLLTGETAAVRIAIDKHLRDLPFDADALVMAGWTYVFLGEPQPALECFERMKLLSRNGPYQALGECGMGAALVELGRLEEALPACDRAIRICPEYVAPYRWKAAALAHLGRLDQAQTSLTHLENLLPGQSVDMIRANSRYVDNAETRLYFDGLRLAGMPE